MVERLGEKLGIKLRINEIKILDEIYNNKNITIDELTKKLNLSHTAIENNITNLKEKKLLNREGSRKYGYWKIIVDEVSNEEK